MRLLVTGGSGFLGGTFVAQALALGDEVVDVDVLTYAADPKRHAGASGYSRVEVDVRKLHPSRLPDRPFDAIVHFAAQTHVDNALAGPEEAVSVNVLGTVRLLEIARTCRAPRVILMSTDEVTGDRGFGGEPSDNRTPLAPSSPYSAAKAAAELLAGAWRRSYGTDVVLVRATNLYGPYQHPEKFIPRTITHLLSGKSAPLYGDGLQVRDWLHVEDGARGVRAVLTQAAGKPVYCIGARNEQPNADVAMAIVGLLGGAVARVADRPGHDVRYATTPTAGLDWQPTIPWSTGLPATVEWYRSHEAWWRGAIARGGRWAS